MTHLFAGAVQCELHLTHHQLCPGDAVEGYAVITATHPVLLDNAHLEVVGGERVATSVDQVEESTQPAQMQYGVSCAEYVYFRVLYTLAGRPLTTDAEGDGEDDGARYYAAAPPQRGLTEFARDGDVVCVAAVEHDNHNNVAEKGAGVTHTTPPYVPLRTYSHDPSDVPVQDGGVVNDSLHRSFLLHAMRSHLSDHVSHTTALPHPTHAFSVVRYPAGRYVYPFCCPLPTDLFPSYDTGTCVKDAQYSASKASLQYYVKLRLLGRHGHVLAHARADFVLLSSRHASVVAVTGDRDTTVDTMLRAVQQTTDTAPCADEPAVVVNDDARTVTCRFHAAVLGGLWSSDTKLLLARLTLRQACYVVGRDAVVLRGVFVNHTGHALKGVRVVLRQYLTFTTATAQVTTWRDIAEAVPDSLVIPVAPHGATLHDDTICAATTVAAHADKTFVVDFCTNPIPDTPHVLPTMHTAGLRVRYVVRLELLSRHVSHGHYEFDEVRLVRDVDAGSLRQHTAATTREPCATPIGSHALTRPEYTVYHTPRYPVVEAVLPTLEVLSRFPTPAPSHSASRVHSRLPSPDARE